MKKIIFFLFSLLFPGMVLFAQQTDQRVLKQLKKNISFLSADKLEGRRTGTPGEKLAYGYISKAFKKAGLQPAGTAAGSFLQPFVVNEGKVIAGTNYLAVDNHKFIVNKDYFPLPYSAPHISDKSFMGMKEQIDIKEMQDGNKNNPHFDLHAALIEKIISYEKAGAELVILHNGNKDFETFSANDKTAAFGIPVLYLKQLAYDKLNADKGSLTNIAFSINISEKKSTGHNVVGIINNNAAYTIVLGAHYDHLGYGEDHNSLYTGTKPMVHNGADDNASGTAALIALASWIKESSLTNYNYLFVAFSGEELGLFGSKYFIEHSPVSPDSINYMINMDMVGRLNDSTHGLAIGGYGTSPAWNKVVKEKDDFFRIKLDSSGSGPSDHTSFYRKGIPVLFFFTGTHSDYHKPSDDEPRINYAGELKVIRYIEEIVRKLNDEPKLAFTKTREAQMGRSTFKVSLGIMPDYTYNGSGVRVDGVSAGKAAEKAGIKTGDVIIKLGTHPFTDVMSYMGALNKFEKGETTTATLMRDGKEIQVNITF